MEVLKISQFQWKTPVLESLFNEVAGLKDTYCEEHLQTTASESALIEQHSVQLPKALKAISME